MTRQLNIALAQCNFWVGDIEGNTDLILARAAEAKASGADLVLFSELAITGYMAEDLYLRPDCTVRVERALARIREASQGIAIVVGHPWREGETLYNSASVYSDGQLLGRYHKQFLPNYHVFDEVRYFATGNQSCVVEFAGHRLGLLICEDLWHPDSVAAAKRAGAEVLLTLNSSPYHWHKHPERIRQVGQRAVEFEGPIVYLNAVNGHDDLIFDGRSLVVAADGQVTHQLPAFEEALDIVSVVDGKPQGALVAPELAPEEDIYQGLVLALRDYVRRNGFEGAVLGLSGGIDSALTLAIACDALGADKVQAVMMPYHYTASISVEDAREEAEALGVKFDIVPIARKVDAFMESLGPMFTGLPRDTTEENLQARCRGVLLMAISNKTKRILLTTGNKSEVAVGYATLYGDMAGGFALLKDLPKIWVYRLSIWRNTVSAVIPERVIERPPSAELAPDQVDQDSLPPYDVLDDIIERYVEKDQSLAEIVAVGYDEDTVRRVLWLIDINEYKRRQAAVGPRITTRSFERNRRYPITNGFGRNRI